MFQDQKIRHYKIDDRKRLRDINAESWPQAFNDYLTELGCTVVSSFIYVILSNLNLKQNLTQLYIPIYLHPDVVDLQTEF